MKAIRKHGSTNADIVESHLLVVLSLQSFHLAHGPLLVDGTLVLELLHQVLQPLQPSII